MKKLSQAAVESASLEEQRQLVKTLRPRTLIYLRAYSQFKEIRQRAQAIWASEILAYLAVLVSIWLLNNR